jgi:hypothetical protein
VHPGHATTVQSALVPTLAERGGDSPGGATARVGPVSWSIPDGLAFGGNSPPAQRVPQAASLLGATPPNVEAASSTRCRLSPIPAGDAVQSRLWAGPTVIARRQLLLPALRHRINLFGFVDETRGSTADAALN